MPEPTPLPTSPGGAATGPAAAAARIGASARADIYEGPPAVAHFAGARRVQAAGPNPRSAFGAATGIVGTTPTLATAPDGSVLMALRRGGLARTTDGGHTWRTITPPDLPDGSSHDRGEHGYTWADDRTGRLYYVTFGGLARPSKRFLHWSSGSLLSWSDDSGATWSTAEVGRDTWDWPKVLAGPPVAGPVDGDHPNVMYFFGTHPFVLGPLRKVYRSRDGGATWQPTKSVASDALEPGYGVVGPTGTIYIDEPYFAGLYGQLRRSPYPFKLRQQGKLRLLVSRDEGDSWEHLVIPDARAPLAMYGMQRVAVDADGTLYFAWRDSRDRLPYLTFSRDDGKTWSPKRMIAPPGVRAVNYQVCVTAKEPGHVALSYFGSAQRWGGPSLIYAPDGRPYDGFITETFDATASDPVFWSAQVNAPGRPLLPRHRISDGPGEGQGITFGADGKPWATFTRVDRPFRIGWAVFMRRPPTDLFVGRLF